MNVNYEQDYYSWITHQVEALRQGHLTEIDADHVAQELETWAASERRRVVTHLAILLAYRLKWEALSEQRSTNWEYTMKEQRVKILHLLAENSLLQTKLQDCLAEAYEIAIIMASAETELGEFDFPQICPYEIEDILNNEVQFFRAFPPLS